MHARLSGLLDQSTIVSGTPYFYKDATLLTRGPVRRKYSEDMPQRRLTQELSAIARDVIACERCPRLRAYCTEVARVRRAAYREEPYWGKPVPGFGDPKAWLLIVGLAPGAHGANRTGRMFTGDRSGQWLYGELYRQGLCNRADSVRAGDGLELSGVYIAAA